MGMNAVDFQLVEKDVARMQKRLDAHIERDNEECRQLTEQVQALRAELKRVTDVMWFFSEAVREYYRKEDSPAELPSESNTPLLDNAEKLEKYIDYGPISYRGLGLPPLSNKGFIPVSALPKKVQDHYKLFMLGARIASAQGNPEAVVLKYNQQVRQAVIRYGYHMYRKELSLAEEWLARLN